MSTWAHVDQGWFIPCVKKEKGHNWDHKEKGPRALLCFQGASLNPDPSSPSLASGRIIGSLNPTG